MYKEKRKEKAPPKEVITPLARSPMYLPNEATIKKAKRGMRRTKVPSIPQSLR